MTVDLITYSVPANQLIDTLRVVVAFIGLIHLQLALVRFAWHQAFWAGIAFMATGLLTILQQMEAIGDPLVPWRLPLYALMNAAGIVFLYRMGRHGREDNAFE